MAKTAKGMFGAKISLEEAILFVERYKKKFNTNGRGTIHVTFPVYEIENFIRDRGLKSTDFLRFYFGRNGDHRTIIIVGAQKGPHCPVEFKDPVFLEIQSIGWDFGTLCPPQCRVPDKNSLAYAVYPSARKAGPGKKKTKKKPSKGKR